MISVHCYFHSMPFFSILKWQRNDRMRGNDRIFRSWQKYWILRHLSSCHHSIIPASFLCLEIEQNWNEEWCQNDWNGLGMFLFYHSILEDKQSNWESKGEAEGSSFRFRYFKKRKLDPSASPLDQSHSILILLIPLSFHLEWWSKGEAEGSCLCLFKSHSTPICLIPLSFHLEWWSKGEAEGSSLCSLKTHSTFILLIPL